MSQLHILVEIAKAVKEVKVHLETLQKYSEAANRAARGKDSFPPPKDVQNQLDANTSLSNKLKRLHREGVSEPQLVNVSLAELANPTTKAMAKQKLKDNLTARQDHVLTLRKYIQELSSVEKEAKAKSKAALEIRDFWGKVMKAPLPDIGTINKTTYFSYQQIFQKISGSLGSVEQDCQQAVQRLTKDLTPYEKDTKASVDSLKTTFGIIVPLKTAVPL